MMYVYKGLDYMLKIYHPFYTQQSTKLGDLSIQHKNQHT